MGARRRDAPPVGDAACRRAPPAAKKSTETPRDACARTTSAIARASAKRRRSAAARTSSSLSSRRATALAAPKTSTSCSAADASATASSGSEKMRRGPRRQAPTPNTPCRTGGSGSGAKIGDDGWPGNEAVLVLHAARNLVRATRRRYMHQRMSEMRTTSSESTQMFELAKKARRTAAGSARKAGVSTKASHWRAAAAAA